MNTLQKSLIYGAIVLTPAIFAAVKLNQQPPPPQAEVVEAPVLINYPTPTSYDPPQGQITESAATTDPSLSTVLKQKPTSASTSPPPTPTAEAPRPAGVYPMPQLVYVPPPAPTQPPQQAPIIQPKTMTIKVISPIAGKGLGREYLSRSEIKDEANYIELGLIVRDENDNVLNNAVVKIEATDAEQNKVLEGTGDMTKIYVNGEPRTIYYYHFHYEFKTPGTHTITFKTNGVTETVTLEVTEDTRP